MVELSEEIKIQNYWKLASVCKEDADKINFYDLYPDAFDITFESQEELENAKLYFQQEWGVDLENYEEKHADYPNEFKVIAFDHCILNGMAYSEVKNVYGFYD